MKRIFHHFDRWEDYHHGMYAEDKENRPFRVRLAAMILSQPTICERAMRLVVENWRLATEVNLSNATINRRAWLGQAACSYYAGIHEDETREAWGMLTVPQRTLANEIATQVIREWLAEHDDGQEQEQPTFDDWDEMF